MDDDDTAQAVTADPTQTHAVEGQLLLVSRRSVTRSAAWTTPVIAASATVPAFASSCLSSLTAAVTGPNEPADGVFASRPRYDGVRFLTFTATYMNTESVTLPVGTEVRFVLAYDGYWDGFSAAPSSGVSLSAFMRASQPGTTDLGEPAEDAVWTATLTAPLAAEAAFTITYRVRLRTIPTSGPTYPRRPRLGLRAHAQISNPCTGARINGSANLFYINNLAN